MIKSIGDWLFTRRRVIDFGLATSCSC